MSEWFESYGFDDVGEGLVIGAYPQDAEDVDQLVRAGITRILNLVEDHEYENGARNTVMAALSAAGIDEWRTRLVDHGGLAPEEIEAATMAVLTWLASGERVYLHCRAGMQRSATIAAAVISVRDDVSLLAALQSLHQSRPSAEPMVHQREDLAIWWQRRAQRARHAPGMH